MRVLLAGFILISVVIALDPPAFIAQLMGISWGALAGAFLATVFIWTVLERGYQSSGLGQFLSVAWGSQWQICFSGLSHHPSTPEPSPWWQDL